MLGKSTIEQSEYPIDWHTLWCIIDGKIIREVGLTLYIYIHTYIHTYINTIHGLSFP